MKTITITDRSEITSLILSCPYCNLGLVDAEGHPYVIPMNFLYVPDEGEWGTAYLHSGPHGGKVQMLEAHPQVCLSFTAGSELVSMHRQVACSYSMKSTSVVCRGTAVPLTDFALKRAALEGMMRQYTDYPCRPIADPAINNVLIWRIEITDLSCRSFGHRPSEL